MVTEGLQLHPVAQQLSGMAWFAPATPLAL
jgi:hypothetical protein